MMLKTMMLRRLGVLVVAVAATLTLGVVAVRSAQAGTCITDSGVSCGGAGLCCMAGPTICITWRCDY